MVSHYWLSLDNADLTHAVLPDGAVDLVIRTCGTSTQSRVYGTTTSRTDVALEQHNDYFGICFKPGQSRHFIDAAANELTDGCEIAEGLLSFSLAGVAERIGHDDLFALLDSLLEKHVARQQPVHARIDDVIELIEATRGTACMDEAVAAFGKSRRQFERVFLETVGVSAKFFSSITRFRHAAALIARSSPSLADIAVASGYSDQSHLSHAFRRLAGVSPMQFARRHVAFIQDRQLF